MGITPRRHLSRLGGRRPPFAGVWVPTPCRLTLCAVFLTTILLSAFGRAEDTGLDPIDGLPAGPPPAAKYDWQDRYAYWRDREPISVDHWLKNIPQPIPAMSLEEWEQMDNEAQNELFDQCLTKQAQDLSHHVLRYQSPDVLQVRARTLEELAARGAHVVVSIFWGRERYVRILWPYLERNLRVNKGIVDKIILITKPRDSKEGNAGARAILESAVKQYPGIVEEVPFCPKAYGCAFDEIMNNTNAVYVKMDDDIVFIKDGSIEHLVLQTLTNKNYVVYSGGVVNNPHGYGVHHFVGAFPPQTFHSKDTHGLAHPPFFKHTDAVMLYYGKNVYDAVGIRAHEAFVYNVAHGRLDVYSFDIWNMNQCRCARPQPGLDMCSSHGYYRWSINAISWMYNVSSHYHRPVPSFDEPAVSMGWPGGIEPHRSAMVGEALFVHCQYTRQRNSRPDFGLREEILLPWYAELMEQYLATEYGEWAGNTTLYDRYERRAWLAGEDRFSRSPKSPRGPLPEV